MPSPPRGSSTLIDVGAEVGEQQRRVRARQQARQVEDAHAVERAQVTTTIDAELAEAAEQRFSAVLRVLRSIVVDVIALRSLLWLKP